MVTEAVDSYRIIEHDPQSQASRYLPSYLVHAEAKGYEAEFLTLSDKTLTIATLPASAIRPIDRDEIAHVRRVAHG